jgi:hypothetical protein
VEIVGVKSSLDCHHHHVHWCFHGGFHLIVTIIVVYKLQKPLPHLFIMLVGAFECSN